MENTKTKTIRVEPGKMHLYVNGRHKLSVNEDVAHEIADTYMRQGDTVWLSRTPIIMEDPKHQLNRRYGKAAGRARGK